MRDRGGTRRPGDELKVLIVDSSPLLRRALQPVLARHRDIQIQGEAENGLEAIELTGRLKPDVILISDQITDLSSYEVARLIEDRYPGTRVIIVAADEGQRPEAWREGSGGHIAGMANAGRALVAIKDELRSMRSHSSPKQIAAEKPIRGGGRLWQAVGTLSILSLLVALIAFPSFMLPLCALLCGFIFFSYGLKYYLSVAFILLATRNGNNHYNHRNSNGLINGRGLNGLSIFNGSHIHLPRQPFISIHLPLYNEPNVIDRLLTACTSQDYDNYEIIVADDSIDETTQMLHQRWGTHPRVTISHRENRSGFKGGALQLALERTNPRAEFIVVLDADFIPPPDLLKQFLSYFYDLNGNGSPRSRRIEEMHLLDESVAVVQGYQWHILNATENWITSGIRSEFSGSYVVERSGQEIMGAMKMISGSVFMIRTDVLRKIGWKTSITEDWELTLRLYLEGYKVLYSPFIQAPAECVSEFKQLARQRMRWAEGHTFNVKKYFWRILLSPKVSLREKVEFFYFAPYYLQSAFFLFGTTVWLLSEVVLNISLPFWSEFLGWSLVIVNCLSLPLMNLAGLFLERGVSRSWKGILSFWLLSYLLAPYQAYAAIKGLLEPREGGWHRTQKTGVITEVVEKLTLRRHLKGLGKRKKKKRQVDLGKRLGGLPSKIVKLIPTSLLRLPRRPGLGLRLSSGMVVGLLLMWIVSSQVPLVSAAAGVLYLRDSTTNGASPAGEDMNDAQGSSENTIVFNSTDDDAYWYTALTYPTGGEDASIAAGAYKLNMYFDALPAAPTTNYYETTVPSFTTTSTTCTNVTGGSLTFTPGSTSEIWVILISARLGSSSTSQINTEACFTVNSVEKGMGGVQVYTSSSRASWQDFYRVTNTTAQQTVQVQLRHASGNTATIEDLKIIAFKMPADADFYFEEDTSTQDVTGGSWNTYENLTFTPSSAGDYLIMAVANFSEGPGVSNIGVRVKDPSASYWPEDTNTGSDMLGHFESGRTTWYTAFAARVQTLTATQKTYLIEGYGDDADGGTIRYTRIMALRTDAFDSVQSDEDLSQSSTTSTSPVVKSVVTTTAPPASRDYIIIQSLALKASASSTEARQAGFEADDAVQTSYNHVTNNSATYVSGGFFDALTTSSSIKYENTFSTSDSGYTVDCKESVIHVLRLPASTSPSVSIQVSLYHTNSTGGDATEITTSSTIVITNSTSAPYELDVGSGAAQSFEAADRRRLRVLIDVTAVADGGSFTLAYDSDASKSNLLTPDFVVPGVSLLLILVVIFIPIAINLVVRKQRLATRLVMIALTVITVMTLMGGQILTVLAAANVIYLCIIES